MWQDEQVDKVAFGMKTSLMLLVLTDRHGQHRDKIVNCYFCRDWNFDNPIDSGFFRQTLAMWFIIAFLFLFTKYASAETEYLMKQAKGDTETALCHRIRGSFLHSVFCRYFRTRLLLEWDRRAAVALAIRVRGREVTDGRVAPLIIGQATSLNALVSQTSMEVGIWDSLCLHMWCTGVRASLGQMPSIQGE